MRILRQVGIYSLVYQSEKYYIDNGDEVSEYIDEYLVKPLFLFSDKEFEEFCLNIF